MFNKVTENHVLFFHYIFLINNSRKNIYIFFFFVTPHHENKLHTGYIFWRVLTNSNIKYTEYNSSCHCLSLMLLWKWHSGKCKSHGQTWLLLDSFGILNSNWLLHFEIVVFPCSLCYDWCFCVISRLLQLLNDDERTKLWLIDWLISSRLRTKWTSVTDFCELQSFNECINHTDMINHTNILTN